MAEKDIANLPTKSAVRRVLSRLIERRKFPIKIRPMEHANSSEASLAWLPPEVLLLILEIIRNDHRESLINVGCSCSALYQLTQHVLYSVIKIDLSECGIRKTKALLNRVEKQDLLPAIRDLEIFEGRLLSSCSADLQAFHEPKDKTKVILAETVLQIQRTVPTMSSLRNVKWLDETRSPLLLDILKDQPHVQLHTRAGTPERGQRSLCPQRYPLELLQSAINLYSLQVHAIYLRSEDCLRITTTVRDVILSAPNLKKLTLDIGQPTSGCVFYGMPHEYCGMGLVGKQRPAALEYLDLSSYPFYHSFQTGYPIHNDAGGHFPEQSHWADIFDWSRLRYLRCTDVVLATKIAPKLCALEGIELPFIDKNPVSEISRSIPSCLRSLTIRSIPDSDIESITRHGEKLEKLQIHINEGCTESWGVDAIFLENIRQSCPNLTDLRIDLARSGEWPYRALDILASFTKLRRLTIWFELGLKDDLIKPLVTWDKVHMLHEYVRSQATRQPHFLEQFEVFSGAPRPIGRGMPSKWSYYSFCNSCHFDCRLSIRDDDAAQGKFACRCPGIDEDGHRYLRGEITKIPAKKGFHLECIAPSGLPEWVEVAKYGPKSRKEWHPHSGYMKYSGTDTTRWC